MSANRTIHCIEMAMRELASCGAAHGKPLQRQSWQSQGNESASIGSVKRCVQSTRAIIAIARLKAIVLYLQLTIDPEVCCAAYKCFVVQAFKRFKPMCQASSLATVRNENGLAERRGRCLGLLRWVPDQSLQRSHTWQGKGISKSVSGQLRLSAVRSIIARGSDFFEACP